MRRNAITPYNIILLLLFCYSARIACVCLLYPSVVARLRRRERFSAKITLSRGISLSSCSAYIYMYSDSGRVTQYLYENINVAFGLENDNLYPRGPFDSGETIYIYTTPVAIRNVYRVHAVFGDSSCQRRARFSVTTFRRSSCT